MTTAGSFDAPIEIFGGLVTDMSPADLPHGVSPDCQDVIYSNGGVATRPGLQALFGPLAGNPTINYVKTYETLNAALRTLLLDSNGILYKETTPGTLASVASGLAANSYANSTTLFGREYLAISNGIAGNDLPRQFDDTNFDRVSQSGPGAGPTVVDENVIVAVVASPNGATQPAAVAIAASPNGASENGFLVTIATSAVHGLSAGQSATVAGVGVSGYNGTFPVVSVPSSTQFTYIAGASGLAASGGGTAASATATIQTATAHGFVVGQLVTTAGVGVPGYNGTFAVTSVPDSTHFTFTAATGGLAASGGGTASAAGGIATGVHQVCVIFKTRQGYLTKPSPATSWTASGGKRAVVTNIPTGPSNVVARILCFTGAGGASFFYVGAGATLFSGTMIVNDNTTTSAVVDFSDAILLAATNVDNLFRLIELGCCAGVIDYAQRLFWWGERNKLNNFVNLGFDGGFTGPSLPHYPLGWTPDPVFAPGGTDEENFVVWGAAYSIVGNGSTATRGLITQSAVQDALGAPLIQANTDYTVRARCARNSTLVQGNLHVNLFSASAGINTTGLQLSPAQLTTSYAEYTAQLTAPLASIPSDLDSAEDIAGRPPINITYTGRKTATDKTRKWSPWTIAANSCALIERGDGTALVAMGGGVPGVGGGGATGKAYQLNTAQLSDDGTAIPSYYTTHYFPERAVEQALSLGAHRKLFSYLTMYVEGAGSLALTSFTNSPSVAQAQQALLLSSPAVKDLELPINVLGERVAFQVSTNQSGAWFRLQKFTPSLRIDPWSPVRGLN